MSRRHLKTLYNRKNTEEVKRRKKVKHTTCLRESSRRICWSETAAKMKLCNGRFNTSEQPKEHAKIREWGCAVLRNMFKNIKVCSSQCTYVQHLYRNTCNSVIMQHPNELDAKLPQMPCLCHKTIKTEQVGDGTFFLSQAANWKLRDDAQALYNLNLSDEHLLMHILVRWLLPTAGWEWRAEHTPYMHKWLATVSSVTCSILVSLQCNVEIWFTQWENCPLAGCALISQTNLTAVLPHDLQLFKTPRNNFCEHAKGIHE